MQRSAPSDSPPWWEQLAAGVIVVLLTGALVGPVFAPTQEETPILRLIWLPVYAMTAGLLALRFKQVVRAWPAWICLLLLVVLAFASKYWSIDPAVTQRRTIAMALTGAFAIYLGAVFRGLDLPRLLAHCTLALAIGSLIMVFAFPAIGVHQDVNAGLWRGLWYEKNAMGWVMVMGAVAAASWLAAESRLALVPTAALGLAVLLVAATQSKTSLLCLMLGLGIVAGLWAMRKGGAVFTVVAIWSAVVAAATGLWFWETHSADILGALGKDPSLTGRTEIWEALMRRVAERPWTGYGYAAFWGKDSVPADYIRLETGWLVPSAHHGWIDVLVHLGWSGAILVGFLFALNIAVHLFRLGGLGAREGGFSLAYLAVFLTLSFSESVLLSHQNLPWALFMVILARGLTPSGEAAPVPLARRPVRAYQTAPRIAAHSPNGRARPFPVR